jgi:cytochrome P450
MKESLKPRSHFFSYVQLKTNDKNFHALLQSKCKEMVQIIKNDAVNNTHTHLIDLVNNAVFDVFINDMCGVFPSSLGSDHNYTHYLHGLVKEYLQVVEEIMHDGRFWYNYPIIRMLFKHVRDDIKRTRNLATTLRKIVTQKNVSNLLKEKDITDDDVADIIIGILGALGTLLNVVKKFMEHVSRDHHVQSNLHTELDIVVGRDRVPTIHDDLPYLQACINESHRMGGVPLIPRTSTCDIELGGYMIPKNTMIVANTPAIQMSPKHFNDPYRFNPDRFIKRTSSGVKQCPVSSLKPRSSNFTLLPFGEGARGCPGKRVADIVINVVCANLMHAFEWEICDNMKFRAISRH